MKKIIVFAALVMLVPLIGAAQTPKIAYINSDKVLNELPEYQEVKKELEATVKVWQDQLEQMNKELQDGVEDYKKKEALLDPQAKAAKEKNLQDLQQRMRDYQFQKFDQREGEVVRLREQKFGPIQDMVMKVIAEVAKDDGFNFVFDKVEGATMILYADQKYDLTFKVIDRLKRGGAITRPTKSKSTK